LTDNKQRAVADVRLALSKNGGNLGTDGCVSYLFKHCGDILFAPGVNSEELAEIAIDLGAEDIINNDDGSVEIITPPNEFLNIKESFDKADLKYEFAELTMKAETEIELKGSDGERMGKILDFLEDLDDVQEVYTNVVIEDD